jgi:D-alanyl-lipoteichoic acid acyltransferase DltB (MBOAT superfamily)
MSLSAFITTYLYTPIIRSMGKATKRTSAIATVTAMLIAGLWHGPAWTYVLFGLAHGVALVVNQYWTRTKRRLPGWLAVLCTLLFLNCAFVIFRSPNVPTALLVLRRLLPSPGAAGASLAASMNAVNLGLTAALMVTAATISFVGPDASALATRLSVSRYRTVALVLLTVACAVVMSASQQSQFVYGQF